MPSGSTAATDSGAREHFPYDALGPGQERVLERWAIGDRRVGCGDAPGVVEVAEGLFGDEREHLARPAAGERPLFDDSDAIRLDDRSKHGFEVDRSQRAQVDHLRPDTVLSQAVGR